MPFDQTIHLFLDPVNLHRKPDVAVWLAHRSWGPFIFHWLPTHASGHSFVDAWFAILSQKCLKHADDDAQRALADVIAAYNTRHAHPFAWRKGVHFCQCLQDERTGQTQAAA